MINGIQNIFVDYDYLQHYFTNADVEVLKEILSTKTLMDWVISEESILWKYRVLLLLQQNKLLSDDVQNALVKVSYQRGEILHNILASLHKLGFLEQVELLPILHSDSIVMKGCQKIVLYLSILYSRVRCYSEEENIDKELFIDLLEKCFAAERKGRISGFIKFASRKEFLTRDMLLIVLTNMPDEENIHGQNAEQKDCYQDQLIEVCSHYLDKLRYLNTSFGQVKKLSVHDIVPMDEFEFICQQYPYTTVCATAIVKAKKVLEDTELPWQTFKSWITANPKAVQVATLIEYVYWSSSASRGVISFEDLLAQAEPFLDGDRADSIGHVVKSLEILWEVEVGFYVKKGFKLHSVLTALLNAPLPLLEDGSVVSYICGCSYLKTEVNDNQMTQIEFFKQPINLNLAYMVAFLYYFNLLYPGNHLENLFSMPDKHLADINAICQFVRGYFNYDPFKHDWSKSFLSLEMLIPPIFSSTKVAKMVNIQIQQFTMKENGLPRHLTPIELLITMAKFPSDIPFLVDMCFRAKRLGLDDSYSSNPLETCFVERSKKIPRQYPAYDKIKDARFKFSGQKETGKKPQLDNFPKDIQNYLFTFFDIKTSVAMGKTCKRGYQLHHENIPNILSQVKTVYLCEHFESFVVVTLLPSKLLPEEFELFSRQHKHPIIDEMTDSQRLQFLEDIYMTHYPKLMKSLKAALPEGWKITKPQSACSWDKRPQFWVEDMRENGECLTGNAFRKAVCAWLDDHILASQSDYNLLALEPRKMSAVY